MTKIKRDRFDADGNPCTLETLCRREPGWAVSRIRAGDAEAERLRFEIRSWKARIGSVVNNSTDLGISSKDLRWRGMSLLDGLRLLHREMSAALEKPAPAANPAPSEENDTHG